MNKPQTTAEKPQPQPQPQISVVPKKDILRLGRILAQIAQGKL